MINRPDTNAQRLKRHKRVRGKISGTPERPRLNVFRSNTNIYAQVIDDVTGKTLVSASSLEKGFEGKGSDCEAAKKVGLAVAERAKAAGIRRRKIACRHIPGSIAFARMLQPGDNAFQTGFVVRYPALQCDKVSVPGAFAVRREYVPLQNFPFRRKQLMTAADLPGYTVMDYLIEQSAFPIRNGRGPEFYFYACHTFVVVKVAGPR